MIPEDKIFTQKEAEDFVIEHNVFLEGEDPKTLYGYVDEDGRIHIFYESIEGSGEEKVVII